METSHKSLQSKVSIKGMSLEELQEWALSVGQTKYRGTQLFEWMYRHEVLESDEMTSISQKFRDFLAENCIINTLEVSKITPSSTGETNKILLRTLDNQYIEAVSMVENSRHTVCISSQIGCNVDCDFCATGSMGFTRNLTSGEIIDQLIYAGQIGHVPITNIVFMGMGEPFLNYDRVMTAAAILHHRQGFDMGATRITISTSGILTGIKRYIADNHRYKLALSLNATTEEQRSRIMPVNNTWSISDIFEALKKFRIDSHRKIMFEYILIKDFNDTEEDARRLIKLIQDFDCKLNIIPYNDTDGRYSRPDDSVIEHFLSTLYEIRGRISILVRWSKGQDITAACGQLATNQC